MTKKVNTSKQYGAHGKGKGKSMDDMQEIVYREPADSLKNPGALVKEKLYQAVMRDNKTWCIAKILDVRIKKPSESEELNG